MRGRVSDEGETFREFMVGEGALRKWDELMMGVFLEVDLQ